MKPSFTHWTSNSYIYAADSLACESTCRLTVLCEATALGLRQRSCVQSQVGAAGAEGPSAKHIPALGLLQLGQLFEHLAQIWQPKINLGKQEIEREKVHLNLNLFRQRHSLLNGCIFGLFRQKYELVYW